MRETKASNEVIKVAAQLREARHQLHQEQQITAELQAHKNAADARARAAEATASTEGL